MKALLTAAHDRDYLLLITAGKGFENSLTRRHLNIKFIAHFIRKQATLAEVEHPTSPICESPVQAVVGHDHILGDRGGNTGTHIRSILRNEGYLLSLLEDWCASNISLSRASA
jgi:hypothetical protein